MSKASLSAPHPSLIFARHDVTAARLYGWLAPFCVGRHRNLIMSLRQFPQAPWFSQAAMTPATRQGCGLRIAPAAASHESRQIGTSAIVRLNDSIAKRALTGGATPPPEAEEPWFQFSEALGAHLNENRGAPGGEGGIRTPGTVTRTPHFECGAFNHSATSPWRRARQCQLALCKQGALTKQERAAAPCRAAQSRSRPCGRLRIAYPALHQCGDRSRRP